MSLQKGVTDFISETLTRMTPLALFQTKSHPPSLGLGGGSWGDRRQLPFGTRSCPEPRTCCGLTATSHGSQALSTSVLHACNRIRASQIKEYYLPHPCWNWSPLSPTARFMGVQANQRDRRPPAQPHGLSFTNFPSGVLSL